MSPPSQSRHHSVIRSGWSGTSRRTSSSRTSCSAGTSDGCFRESGRSVRSRRRGDGSRHACDPGFLAWRRGPRPALACRQHQHHRLAHPGGPADASPRRGSRSHRPRRCRSPVGSSTPPTSCSSTSGTHPSCTSSCAAGCRRSVSPSGCTSRATRRLRWSRANSSSSAMPSR